MQEFNSEPIGQWVLGRSRQLLVIGTSALIGTSSVALAAASPQVVTTEVVTLAVGHPLSPGIAGIGSVHSDQRGSWVAGGYELDLAGDTTIFFGVLAGSGQSTPSVLRRSQTIQGHRQDSISRPRVYGSEIAYRSSGPGGGLGASSWIDDQLIATPGAPVGSTGLVWAGSGTPLKAAGADFYLLGGARRPGTPGSLGSVVVRYPAETIELAAGDTDLGLSGPVTTIHGFHVHPEGTTWAAIVDFESAATGEVEAAIVVDGSVYMLPGQIPATTESGTWEAFENVRVIRDGGITFQGWDWLGPVVNRNGYMAFRTPVNRLYDVDRNGLALTNELPNQGLGFYLEGESLDRPGAMGVDADGDGAPDAGWYVSGAISRNGVGTFLADGRVLCITKLWVPGVGETVALVKASLALPIDEICQGELHSQGTRCSLRALGTSDASFNDLQLRVTDLPVASHLLPLVSRTPGFVANPGGSFGNLCLAGAIGRGTPVNGSAAMPNMTLRVYPNSMPQPGGSAAALAGETWYCQVWFRDVQMGIAGSNFSSAIAVTFR